MACSGIRVALLLRAPRRLSRGALLTRGMAAGSPQEVFTREQRTPDDGVLRYSTHLVSGRHVLFSDLMPAAQGGDTGPSPKELALLSLGACTSMTVRQFADASKWPLRGVRCTVREHCEEGKHLPTGLSLTIHLDAPELTEAQRGRLLRVAERCPVKQMLSGGLVDGIKTTLA